MSYVFPGEDDPDSPWPIFDHVLTFPELELQSSLVVEYEVRFAFALKFDHSEKGWSRGHKSILGMAMMPQVTGQLRDLFDQLLEDTLGFCPDFLIILNGLYWEGATDQEREALVVHELLHCGQALDKYGALKFTRQENRPVLQMVPHDVEEFDAVVRRYGAWKSDLVRFRGAMDDGDRGTVSNGSAAFQLPEGVTVEVRTANRDRDGTSQGESSSDVF